MRSTKRIFGDEALNFLRSTSLLRYLKNMALLVPVVHMYRNPELCWGLIQENMEKQTKSKGSCRCRGWLLEQKTVLLTLKWLPLMRELKQTISCEFLLEFNILAIMSYDQIACVAMRHMLLLFGTRIYQILDPGTGMCLHGRGSPLQAWGLAACAALYTARLKFDQGTKDGEQAELSNCGSVR